MYSDFMAIAHGIATDEDSHRETADAYWLFNGNLTPTETAHVMAPSVRLASRVLRVASVLETLKVDFDSLHDPESGVEDLAASSVVSYAGRDIEDLEATLRLAASQARGIAANIGHWATRR